MAEGATISLLFLLGIAILMIEIFVPSHGLLGLVGMGVLGYGLYRLFIISQVAGFVGLAVLAIALPTAFLITIKNWHRTPAGKYISSPNPQLTAEDRMPVENMKPLIGKVGLALTPLRPVGTCVFDGQRVECTAEHGMIEKGAEVEGIRLIDRTLSVRAFTSGPSGSESQA